MKKNIKGSRNYRSRPHDEYVKDGKWWYQNTAYTGPAKGGQTAGAKVGSLSKAKSLRKSGLLSPEGATKADRSKEHRERRIQALYGRSTPPDIPALLGDEVEEQWRDLMNARLLSRLDGAEIARRVVERFAQDGSTEDSHGPEFASQVRMWGRKRHEGHDSDTLSLVAAYLTHGDPKGQVCNVRGLGSRVFSVGAPRKAAQVLYSPSEDEYQTLTHVARPVNKEGEMILDPSQLKWVKLRKHGTRKLRAEGREPRPSKKQIRKTLAKQPS